MPSYFLFSEKNRTFFGDIWKIVDFEQNLGIYMSKNRPIMDGQLII